jgi:hypothetical protein
LYPQGSAAILGKAFVYDVRGDKNNALAGYRRYLEVADPDNQEIKEVKARMEKLNQSADSSAASTPTVPASSGASALPDDVTIPTSTAPASSAAE